MRKSIEIWSDSFHEGEWCCDNITNQMSFEEYECEVTYRGGFQPIYTITRKDETIELIVYGSYKSWKNIPKQIEDLLFWGKPDFIAYDPEKDKILFAIEETAAVATGNQSMQRCERQYGSLKFHIPYWYLISEYGQHIDGGKRRDSIWPSIAAIKLSVIRGTPCIVSHYSDIDNVEDYSSGKGLSLLFQSITKILQNYSEEKDPLCDLEELLSLQYSEMNRFISSQWKNIVDYLPDADLLQEPETAKRIVDIIYGADSSVMGELFHWPLFNELPIQIQNKQHGRGLLKYDSLCDRMERDLTEHLCYSLSQNAGSGKPRTTAELERYIDDQGKKFNTGSVIIDDLTFKMEVEDFPFTDETQKNRHSTTSKNIVYLYDRWSDFLESLVEAYPRLRDKRIFESRELPVFVYVSNSVKSGRIFGDPFTGQLSAYSTIFGKFDKNRRIVVAYFPHQVHDQLFSGRDNKGKTLMNELVDYMVFYGGVVVRMSDKRVF